MKKKVTIICCYVLLCVALLMACISFLADSSLMYGDKTLLSDDLRFFTHNIFKRCFAADYTWTSDADSCVLNIPDECDGYRVTALGGYIGSGGPCPFLVNLPDSHYTCSPDALPVNARIDQYHLVINIGKYLREDVSIAMDSYHNVGSNRFVQILVTVNCSTENPYFYSEDGKLYKRSDDSLVEGFFYYSDYCD